jgi:hypothetical protein
MLDARVADSQPPAFLPPLSPRSDFAAFLFPLRANLLLWRRREGRMTEQKQSKTW